jgi:hypothetical protein
MREKNSFYKYYGAIVILPLGETLIVNLFLIF